MGTDQQPCSTKGADLSSYRTDQEIFWAGEFGDAYIKRNQGDAIVAANTAFFKRVLVKCDGVQSIVEFGANIGLNLIALRRLLPDIRLKAVEINTSAVDALRGLDGVEVQHGSLLDARQTDPFDLAFTKTVLIHLAPSALQQAYDVLYASAKRYLLIAEYYNPTPVEVPYRGHQDRLFKRDFAGEMLERFSDIELVDYGFVYHNAHFPQDDITWFLMEKRASL